MLPARVTTFTFILLMSIILLIVARLLARTLLTDGKCRLKNHRDYYFLLSKENKA